MKTKKCYKCGETNPKNFSPKNFKHCRACKKIIDYEYTLKKKKSKIKKCISCDETNLEWFDTEKSRKCKKCIEVTKFKKLEKLKQNYVSIKSTIQTCQQCGETETVNFNSKISRKCNNCLEISKAKRKVYMVEHQENLTVKICSCGETDSNKFSSKQFYRCRACKKEDSVVYRETNSEQIKVSSKVYRENNIDKRKVYETEYALKNKEKISEKAKIYYDKNKDIILLRERSEYRRQQLLIADVKIANGNNAVDWLFYICKFTHKNGFSFFKYGITSRDIKMRFDSNYSNYNITILKEVYGSEDYIKGVEKKILLETKKDRFKFPPSIKFGGHTECRTKIDLGLVESIIN